MQKVCPITAPNYALSNPSFHRKPFYTGFFVCFLFVLAFCLFVVAIVLIRQLPLSSEDSILFI